MGAAPAALRAAFAQQVQWCRAMDSPFTAAVLERSAAWLERNPAAEASVAAVADDPLAGAVALRWASAMHHLALLGREPWSALWPPAPAPGDADALHAALDAAIAAAWADERPRLDAALARAPQTNEVQRSAVLLPGLRHIAAATGGRAMALLEIGASGGLNLWCDRYPQHHGTWQHAGATAGPVLGAEWRGPPPPDVPVQVRNRAACDLHPVDLREPGEPLRLASYLWAEQRERVARFLAAAGAAEAWMRAEGVVVQALPAADFVERELAQRSADATTVLMHSVVWQYLPAAEQQRIRDAMARAGVGATAAAPLAWLRMEPPGATGRCELRCTLWTGAHPAGEDRHLAFTHPHGRGVEWLAA